VDSVGALVKTSAAGPRLTICCTVIHACSRVDHHLSCSDVGAGMVSYLTGHASDTFQRLSDVHPRNRYPVFSAGGIDDTVRSRSSSDSQ